MQATSSQNHAKQDEHETNPTKTPKHLKFPAILIFSCRPVVCRLFIRFSFDLRRFRFPSMTDVYLLFGRNGWIGGKLIELLKEQGKTVHLSETRTQNRETVIAEIEKFKPTHILNAAGVTGRPNVDWCEDHRQDTIRSNVLGVLTIADVCDEYKIHHLLYATGCIFEYDEEHIIGGKGFLEEDKPNFHASYYSHTKAMVEELLHEYQYTCVLRVRMPISDDLSPRNFVTKITQYEKVVNIPNSMTILHDLLPLALGMAKYGHTGET